MARKKNATRADGRIAVQVYLGRDENDKRKYKTVYGKTQAEANAKAAEIKAKLGKGIDVMAGGDTFGEWYDKWIGMKTHEISNAQLAVYKAAANHLRDAIFAMPLDKINTVDIQYIILNLAEENPNTHKPSSKRLLTSIKQLANQVFQLAIDNRVIDYNPTKSLKIPDIRSSSEKRALTNEEQRWIRETPHRAQTAAMIMLYAGLRRGELVALTWSDIDLKNSTITVNKAAEVLSNRFVVKNRTKTESGMRVVDIPQLLTDYLKSIQKDGVFVCTSKSGQMHTPSSWKRMWESYLKDLNFKYGDFDAELSGKPSSKYDPSGVPMIIDEFTPHELRHTFATMLYFAGVDVLTARDQLGHADIQTTLNIYTHLDNQFKRRSMDKLNAFLNDASHVQVGDSKKL